MGELIYMVNLDKKEYISTTDKMTELELNPEHFQLLLAMLQSNWNGDRIKLVGAYSIDYYPNLKNVTEKAKEIFNEFPKSSFCEHELRKLRLGKITQIIKGKRTEISVNLNCECKESFYFGGKYIQGKVITK